MGQLSLIFPIAAARFHQFLGAFLDQAFLRALVQDEELHKRENVVMGAVELELVFFNFLDQVYSFGFVAHVIEQSVNVEWQEIPHSLEIFPFSKLAHDFAEEDLRFWALGELLELIHGDGSRVVRIYYRKQALQIS